jgi:acetyl esterase/lipase
MVKKFAVVAVAAVILALSLFIIAFRGPHVSHDVVYGNADGVDLKMDLAKPSKGDGPFPAVLCIHGGAWQTGSKDDFGSLIVTFAQNGYLAASAEYRMAPNYKWPAEIEDVKCAVRYLRAHAKELNIDPNNIYATGASAGGHLALMLGVTDPKDGLEGTGGNPQESSRVQAVANFYGPSDLRLWNAGLKKDIPEQKAMLESSKKILEDFLGTSDRSSPVMATVSPITHIDANDAPIITFHGTKDNIVSIDQAKLLHAVLEKAGVPQKLVIVEGEGHGWGGETMKDSIRQTLSFFAAHAAKSGVR